VVSSTPRSHFTPRIEPVPILQEDVFVQYATENLSGQQLVLVSLVSVDIQPTVDSGANDKQKSGCAWSSLSQVGKIRKFCGSTKKP